MNEHYNDIYSVVYEQLDDATTTQDKSEAVIIPATTYPTKSVTHTTKQNVVVLARRGCTSATEAYRWHDRWRTIMFDMHTLEQPTSLTPEHRSRLLALRSLVRDFQEQSEKYGKIIIEERDVPNEFKTLKPNQMGGFAGGDKYLYAGILFKFADSVPLPTELANKISAIEFNSAQAIHHASDRTCSVQKQLAVPLTTVLDYLGFRLEAVAFSPINNATLVYGSSNAGKNIYKKDPTTNLLMKEYGEKLNLCPHLVHQRSDGTEIEVYGAADVEVHLVKEGKYSSEGAAREWSTVVDVSIPPLSFKSVSLFLPRSPPF
jgi:hypothetical protein